MLFSLGSFGGRGEKIMDECLCGGGVGGGVESLYPAVRFVVQRLKLTMFSCILNPDWLLVMSTTLCPTQIPHGVPCVSCVNLYHTTFLTTAKRGLQPPILSFQQKVTDFSTKINQNFFRIVAHSNILTFEIVL